MKFLFTLALTMSFIAFAQEEESYKYQPETNKAEYYIGTYNKGKDFDDLAEWYGKFAKWAEGQSDIYKNMTVAILQPQFHSNMGALDVMWVNTFPTPSEQFTGLETWVTGGGAKLLDSLPVTNSQQVDTWQWTLSQPASMVAGNVMYATYSDCSLEEGYTMRKVHDLYKDFAIYAQSVGDTTGRKMIVPTAGAQLPDGVDFVRLMYSSSISESGANAELFWEKIAESEANSNLKGFSCNNGRSYIGTAMRTPG
ncbi:hypothetical protein N8Z97_02710 [Gammaproteobacteria bacterium]|nr:hypothetical protein [Gammaproteobacteria bacterium]